MITLVCGTNRPGNKTLGVLHTYKEMLERRGEKVATLEMSELPHDFSIEESFGKRTQKVEDILAKKIRPAVKLVFITPEYNGSYPGILKIFFDGIHPREFHGKKAALVGVASGRAGNLRGMDHLTDVLHHLQVEVLSYKVPISRLDEMVDDNDRIIDAEVLSNLNTQIDRFMRF